MALQEVTPEQLAALQAELQDGRRHKVILDKLGRNPKTRTKLFELLKEDDPSLVIPELDAAKPLMEKLSTVEKELNDMKAETKKEKDEREAREREEAVKREMSQGRDKLREQGFTSEGIEGVEKLMQERGIMNYEDAAILFEKTQPAGETVMPSIGRDLGLFDPPTGNPWKEAVNKPKGPMQERMLRTVQNNEINKFFVERGNNGQFRKVSVR